MIGEEQAQRTTRIVAKSIETLFRSGAYTEEMDAPRDIRASQVLTPRTQLIEFKQEERAAEVKREELRPALEPAAAEAVPSAPKAAEILRDLKDQLEMKEAVKS